MEGNGMMILGGNSNPMLLKRVCESLRVEAAKAKVAKFSDGETRVEIEENVRGKDVFVMQSTCNPVNDYLMELLLIIDALKRASAKSITAVMPYFGYARQDKKVSPRVPISAKLVGDMITKAGASRILTIELHAGQIQGFFDIPVDNLFGRPIYVPRIRQMFNSDLVIVSPDTGGVERARAYAKHLNAGLAIIDKRRSEPNKAHAMNVVGNVKDKKAILLDDMIDTAGTLKEAAKALAEHGACEIYACAAHPVLSGPAIERLDKSVIKKVLVSDTIPLSQEAQASPKIKVISFADILAEAIKRIYNKDSITALF